MALNNKASPIVPTSHQIIINTRSISSNYIFKTSDVEILKINGTPVNLGSGGLGEVYKAKFQGGIVAVKALKEMNSSIQNEFNILHNLFHPNIVQFLGITLDEEPFYLINEFVSGGNLSKWLLRQSSDDNDLQTNTEPLLFQISRDICYGLIYLHSKGILHLDLNCQNILVDVQNNQVIPKICDFGISKILPPKKPDESIFSTFQLRGTYGFMAPETTDSVLEIKNKNNFKPDFKCDIFSLGIVFWQIFHQGKDPFPSYNFVQILSQVDRKERPKFDDEKDRFFFYFELKEMIEKMWQNHPKDRPELNEVLTFLNKSINSAHITCPIIKPLLKQEFLNYSTNLSLFLQNNHLLNYSLFSLFPKELSLQLNFFIYENYFKPSLHPSKGFLMENFDEKEQKLVYWGYYSYDDNNGSNKIEVLPVEFKFNQQIKQIGCGGCFTLILTTSGEIYSFGDNTKGRLGIGKNIQDSEIPQKINFQNNNNNVFINEIIVGSGHSFAISKENLNEKEKENLNQKIYCWGLNRDAQLGIGNKKNQFLPIEFKFNQKIKQIGCGQDFTLILTSLGEIYSFGDNGNGELGIGKNIKNSEIPQKINFTNNNNEIFINEIVVGCFHSFAISKENLNLNQKIYCWGYNGDGSLGIENKQNQFLPIEFKFNQKIKLIGCGWNFTLILTTLGEIYSFGYNGNENLGIGKNIQNSEILQKINFPKNNNNEIFISEIIVGRGHSFAISKENLNQKIYCWGGNYWGQLGIGNKEDQFLPIEWNFNGKKLFQVFTNSTSQHCFGIIEK